jgi:hypothetical protein
MKKLNPYIHYINKAKTKHYYQNHIFTNNEWNDFIHGGMVQHIKIATSSKYRKVSYNCDRYHRIGKEIFPCQNKPFYKSDNYNMYFCKSCAREINIENNNASFTKIEKE